MAIIVLLLLNVGCIFICYFFAKWRKANAIYWAVAGSILGPLAFPFLLFAKPQSHPED